MILENKHRISKNQSFYDDHLFDFAIELMYKFLGCLIISVIIKYSNMVEGLMYSHIFMFLKRYVNLNGTFFMTLVDKRYISDYQLYYICNYISVRKHYRGTEHIL